VRHSQSLRHENDVSEKNKIFGVPLVPASWDMGRTFIEMRFYNFVRYIIINYYIFFCIFNFWNFGRVEGMEWPK
jgi:hypothetical protein